MKIILIDSGIDLTCKIFASKNITGLTICDCQIKYGAYDESGHGTGIASIIASRLADVELLCLKILHENGTASEDDLIYALEYLYDNEDPAVVNISAGIIQPEHLSRLERICTLLREKGFAIIASFDNAGAVSYPAAFKTVIGVAGSTKCRKDNEFISIDNSIINYYAKGIAQSVTGLGDTLNYVSGSSYAAPYVTIAIFVLLKDGLHTVDTAIQRLNELCIRSIKCQTDANEYKWNKIEFQSAIAFPFNKEIHSLVRYSDMMVIKLLGIYNLKYMGNIGKRTSDFINSKASFEIKNIDDLNWDDAFDLFILGHCDKIAQVSGFNVKENIIFRCLKHKKNIFALDSKYIDNDIVNEFAANGLNVYVPSVCNNPIGHNAMGRMYIASTPICGIFGTSSVQGKFSLQLKLRSRFENDGYKIGELGTEPIGELFGMDNIFPIGHNANKCYSSSEIITSINGAIHRIDCNENDIIIVGGQSGCIPYQIRNLDSIPYMSYEFLIATNPDIFILCVNYEDDVSYIMRTIHYVEGLVDAKLVGLVMYPLYRRITVNGLHTSSDTIPFKLLKDRCVELSDKLGTNCFINGLDSDMAALKDSIISALS